MCNWIKQNADLGNPVRLHLLLPGELESKETAINTFAVGFGVTCHFCRESDLASTRLGKNLLKLPGQTWDYLQAYAVAYRYFATLFRLERDGVTFDLIEFPDYGGWGALAIEAKRLGISFAQTELCVRLHSSFGIIIANEPYYHHPSTFSGAMVDLERFALLHADRIVVHQRSILDYNQAFYRFDSAWRAKALVETPPILLDDFETDRNERPRRRFVFSSRLQPFKRPDLFIRAACLYFVRYPDDEADALIVSYGWDTDYIASLQAIVPGALQEKVKFVLDAKGEERQALLEGAVVVIPSDYESHCLFAYETAAMRRRLLLRKDCLAFGQDEGWIDGDNCLMFGSDPAELAETMRRAVDWTPRFHRVVDPSQPYWVACGRTPVPVAHPKMTHEVFVHGLDDDVKIDRAFELVQSIGLHRASLLLSPLMDAPAVRQAASQRGLVVEIHSLAFNDDDFAEIWRHGAASSADIVTFVDAEDRPDILYFKVAEAAFSRCPGLGVLTSNEGLVDARSGRDLGFRPLAGEHLVSGTTGLGVVGRLFSMRTHILTSTRYPAEARSFALPSIFSDMALGGKLISVLPDLYNTVSSEVVANRDPRWIATKMSNLTGGALGCGFGIGLPVAPNPSGPGALLVLRITAGPDVPVERLLPAEPLSWGDPVSYNAEHNGLLVHPVDGGPTVARLSLPGRGLTGSTFFVEVENRSTQNPGFHFALILGTHIINDLSVLNELAANPQNATLDVIGPLERKTIYASADPKTKETHLYLLSAPMAGKGAHGCLALVLSYGVLQR